jgi:hypothetical protein
MRGQGITTIRSNQSFAVNEIESLGCFVLCKTAVNKIIFQHCRNTDTSTSCSEKHESMFVGFYPRTSNCVDETAENDGCSALDLLSVMQYGDYIVVETRVFVSPFVKQVEREFSVEVLELDKHPWPAFLDCSHELCNKLLGLLIRNSFLSETHVQRIFEIFFIVGAVVESDLLSATQLQRLPAEYGGDLFQHMQCTKTVFQLEFPSLMSAKFESSNH